ncbi:hypothetical protein L6R50_18770 [Myxococcota bacterium]|nr:hypothetical protein [Myxococcota bacterium]
MAPRVPPSLPAWIATGAVLLAAAGCAGTQEAEGDGEGAADGAGSADADGDAILDVHEGPIDHDGDGLPDYEDPDSDGDHVPDRIEAGDADVLTLPFDVDGDGAPDFLDTDSDDNGIGDRLEAGSDPEDPVDTDGDGVPDPSDLDNDGDGLPDVVEMAGDPASPPDSDRDGAPDYLDTDSDGDGIDDVYEAGTGAFDPEPRDSDQDGTPDYLDLDSDGDGIPDRDEAHLGCAGCPPRDLDGDGLYDAIDPDADGDGIGDSEEALGPDGVPGSGDETDPYDADTDGDGYTDGAEALGGSSPTDPHDWPDGVYVIVEERSTTDERFTFTTDVNVADVVFLLDTTCSMGSTVSAMSSSFSSIVARVGASIPNVAFGVAQFRDYNDQGFGGGSDLPFYLEQQVTTDTARVQAALSGLSASGGSDWEESALEALFQAVTGEGYDQDCDDAFDSQDDVAPFLASPFDAFGGTVPGAHDPATPGSGDGGGVGFRPYSLPIVVWASDAEIRDPDGGYPAPDPCSAPAGLAATAEAVNAVGAKVIAVEVDTSADFLPQATEVLHATGSYADLDGDGVAAEPLAFTGTDADVVDSVVEGIVGLAATGVFDVTLEVPNDTHGFVTGISPAAGYPGVPTGTSISFTLSFAGVVAASTEDQLFHLDLDVVGDGVTLLDQLQIILVVPGSAN